MLKLLTEVLSVAGWLLCRSGGHPSPPPPEYMTQTELLTEVLSVAGWLAVQVGWAPLSTWHPEVIQRAVDMWGEGLTDGLTD